MFLFLFPSLAYFTNLSELDLSHNLLGDSSVPLIVSLVNSSPSLVVLRYPSPTLAQMPQTIYSTLPFFFK